MTSLHAKLIVVVLAAALTGASLLVCRHHRIEVAYRMARVHERHVEQERAMWNLRSTTAERCRPGIVREMMDSLGEAWATLPARESVPPAAGALPASAPTPSDVRSAAAPGAPIGPDAREPLAPRAAASPGPATPSSAANALASRGAGGG